eukprot:Tbor_TRINITY_DN5286_c0_g2::TRINITY_DN5286_c0_g2_i2::g.16861::m.16861
MFRATLLCLPKGQYKTRLKKRMVGFIPKVVPRKVRGALISIRSESNTGAYLGTLRTETERVDSVGKKVERLSYDPIVGRYTIHKEAKIKTPVMTKMHIVKKPLAPYQMN